MTGLKVLSTLLATTAATVSAADTSLSIALDLNDGDSVTSDILGSVV